MYVYSIVCGVILCKAFKRKQLRRLPLIVSYLPTVAAVATAHHLAGSAHITVTQIIN